MANEFFSLSLGPFFVNGRNYRGRLLMIEEDVVFETQVPYSRGDIFLAPKSNYRSVFFEERQRAECKAVPITFFLFRVSFVPAEVLQSVSGNLGKSQVIDEEFTKRTEKKNERQDRGIFTELRPVVQSIKSRCCHRKEEGKVSRDYRGRGSGVTPDIAICGVSTKNSVGVKSMPSVTSKLRAPGGTPGLGSRNRAISIPMLVPPIRMSPWLSGRTAPPGNGMPDVGWFNSGFGTLLFQAGWLLHELTISLYA